MRANRRLLLVLTVLLVGGSISWTAAYGLRLRSEGYRADTEARLTAFFELPSEVGRIRGQTFSSRVFEDVVIWLPDRRDKVFSCEQAIWQESRVDGRELNELELLAGVLALGSDRWVREDFRTVLKSGLAHNFEDLNLTRVTLEDFEISFERGSFALRCRDTAGSIDMTNPADGVARLHAYELNGQRITQGVQIHARFLPTSGIQVSEVLLSLPRVPLATLGLDGVLGGRLTTGSFAGSVQYLDAEEGAEVWLTGELDAVELVELTQSLSFGPLEGRLSVAVDAARLAQETVTHFRGRGRVSGFELERVSRMFGLVGLGGQATFDFDSIDIALGQINRLRFSGGVSGLSLKDWLSPLGRGGATGRLSVRVNNVDIAAGDIKSADIEVSVVPPPGQPGTIDRELLISAVQEILGMSWPSAVPERLLPEKVEYVEFGFRLLIRDNQLRVLGSHGPDGDTILTVKVAGMAFGVVKEQAGAVDLSPYMAKLRDRARSYDAERVREWLKSHSSSPGGS